MAFALPKNGPISKGSGDRNTPPKSSGVMPAVSSRRGAEFGLRRHVLVVDDDAPSLRACERVLSRHDVEIMLASTVGQAFHVLSVLEHRPYPMVAFVDVVMPGMVGPEFVHALSRIPAFGRSPVVLFSGLSAQALDKTVIEWGAAGYVQKTRGLLHVDQEFAAWLERVG